MSEYFQKRLAAIKQERAERELKIKKQQEAQYLEWRERRKNDPSTEQIQKWADERKQAIEDRQTRTRVYVFPAREYVKIGVSWNVKQRWETIRCYNPLLEKAAYVSDVLFGLAWEVEKESHRRLEYCRVNSTEWFQCESSAAIETVKTVITEFKKRAQESETDTVCHPVAQVVD